MAALPQRNAVLYVGEPLRPWGRREPPRWLAAIGNRSLNLVCPPRCADCDLPFDEPGPDGLCAACREELAPVAAPRCLACGEPVRAATDRVDCGRCAGRRYRFDSVLPLGDYTRHLRSAVLRAKHAMSEPLALALAGLLAERQGEAIAALDPDVIAAVPMHWRRRMQRGVNSPDLVAEALGRRLKLPVARGLLRRHRDTPPQAGLLPSQRIRNVRGAFRVSVSYSLDAARVLLVDDVLTTGATCSEAAVALRRAGAARVDVAVLARALKAE